MSPNYDRLTLGGIAVVAYIISNVLHEAVGHGGLCLLVGGDPTALSTAYFDMADSSVSMTGRRLVAAGGTIVNLAAAGLFWAALRAAPSSANRLRYFLWLSMTINLFTGTGYFLFSGVTQFGDWIVVIQGFEPYSLWIVLLIVLGIAGYLLSIRLALVTLLPFVGGDGAARVKRGVVLTVFPYLVGSVAASAGALFNPLSSMFIMTSAAANFGGTSGLAWMTQLYKRSWFEPSDAEPVAIERSWSWVGAAVILLVVYLALLGPSITF